MAEGDNPIQELVGRVLSLLGVQLEGTPPTTTTPQGGVASLPGDPVAAGTVGGLALNSPLPVTQRHPCPQEDAVLAGQRTVASWYAGQLVPQVDALVATLTCAEKRAFIAGGHPGLYAYRAARRTQVPSAGQAAEGALSALRSGARKLGL